jgi:hypothetical protein
MGSVHKCSIFRPSLASLAATTLLLSSVGCEAVLGADFGDYSRVFDTDDAARDTQGGADGGQGASGGSPGSGGRGGTNTGGTGGAGGLSTGGTTGTGGASTGAGGTTTGAGGSGGASTDASTGTGGASTGGSAGSAGTGGSGAGTGIPPGDGSMRDVTVDSPVIDDASSRDAGGGTGGGASDSSHPPPRDGGTTGGMCTPGEVHSIATCQNCGLFLQVCNTQGVWDPPHCAQQGVCAPSSIEHRPCGTGGTQVATCTASCTWSLGACIAPACTVGQMDMQRCGLCGLQTRTCQVTDGGAVWGPFSTCANPGVCGPGTSEVTTCGNCGTRSRVCNPSCGWDAWGPCGGEGECPPTSSETRNCEILLPIIVIGKQTRVCDESCGWGAWSVCK